MNAVLDNRKEDGGGTCYSRNQTMFRGFHWNDSVGDYGMKFDFGNTEPPIRGAHKINVGIELGNKFSLFGRRD